MKYKFRIGDWVKVRATIDFKYNISDERIIVKNYLDKKDYIFGQICGAVKRRLGTYQQRLPIKPFEDDEPEPYLDVKEVITVWLVRTGMLNVPIDTLEEDLERLPWTTNRELPWFDNPMGDFNRRVLSDIMKEEVKNISRDERGRFLKA